MKKQLIAYSLLCVSLTGCSSTSSKIDNRIFSSNNELSYISTKKDYRISSSDLIDIKVFQVKELEQTVRVDNRGYITLPLIGEVRAQGLTESQLKNNITRKLKATYLQDPQVNIFIKEATSQRVTVEGEVKKPSIYPIQSELTALQAIALAGGPTTLAAPDKVILFRKLGNSTKAYRLNINNIRSGQAKDPYLNSDDRLVVHRSNSRFWLKEAATFVSPVNALNNLIN